MKELRSEIEMNASAERVWNILTDFASFPPRAGALKR